MLQRVTAGDVILRSLRGPLAFWYVPESAIYQSCRAFAKKKRSKRREVFELTPCHPAIDTGQRVRRLLRLQGERGKRGPPPVTRRPQT